MAPLANVKFNRFGEVCGAGEGVMETTTGEEQHMTQSAPLAGMYAVADPAYPQVKVGIFTICRQDANSVWIQCDDGEGGQFHDAAFEKAIAEFYARMF